MIASFAMVRMLMWFSLHFVIGEFRVLEKTYAIGISPGGCLSDYAPSDTDECI